MNKLRLFIFALAFSGVLTSCLASKQSATAYNYKPKMEDSSSSLLLASSGDRYYEAERVEKKMLFSAFLSLSVEVPDTANYYIEQIAKRYSGYVSEIGTSRTIIRVKSGSLNDAIEEVSELGNIQRKSLSGQDVTEEYLDYTIRLENAEKSRERYLELLAEAENVEAALKVEIELERLNGAIDVLKGKIYRINHLAEFSTITINLKEKKKPGLLGYIGIGLYQSVKWLFVRN